MLKANIGKHILITINRECYDQIRKPHFSTRYLRFFCFNGGIGPLYINQGKTSEPRARSQTSREV